MDEDNAKKLYEEVRAAFSTQVLKGAEIIPETPEYYVCGLLMQFVKELSHSFHKDMMERDIVTACCENLYKIGARKGIFRHGRILPSGIIKITGKCGAVYPENMTFKFNEVIMHSTFVFKNPADNLPHLDHNGEGYVFAEIVDYTMSEMHVQPFSKGELIGNHENLNNEVMLYGSLCKGKDEEDCEAYRQRLLNSERYYLNNKINIVERYIHEFPCLTDINFIENPACCPIYDKNIVLDKNCVYAMPIFGGVFPIGEIPEQILSIFRNWLFGHNAGHGQGILPIGVCGDVIQLKPQYFDIAIVFKRNILNFSDLQKIKEEIRKFINSKRPGAFVNEAMIARVIYESTGIDFKLCIDFYAIDDKRPEGVIFSGEKRDEISTYCDLKLVVDEITMYNSEGKVIG